VHLVAISRDIKVYYASSSCSNKRAALLRAANALEELDAYLRAAELIAPERSILRWIVHQWQQLVIAEGGAAGQVDQSQPLENPYILNNPAEGGQFVGRDDILRRLEELWGTNPARQAPSVVLYGHRHMGKTSILHNLGSRFGPNTLIVDFDMQRFGRVRSNNQLLFQLATMIQRAGRADGMRGLAAPDAANFPDDGSDLAFNLFLEDLDRARAGRRFIIMVDEFEKIEERIASGILTPDLLEIWRGTFQTFPWLIMAFAGLHTLHEMTHDYWHPLFGSVEAIRVSFLTTGAARQLITNPSPDFPIDYDEDAIARIVELSNCQPYLVQRICHSLVTRFNQQRFEEERERDARFTREEVDAVIDAPDFAQSAAAYFSGVWRQVKDNAVAEQPVILRVLAIQEAPCPLDALAQAARMEPDAAQTALATLCAHDIITEQDEGYSYMVPLMRRWVRRQKVEHDAPSLDNPRPWSA
jgi:hypothetical protein